MWPWRKTEAEPPAPPPVTQHHDVVRAPRADWRLVGPIQRVMSDPPLINPVQRFSGHLAAWQDPSFLAPLAHVVASDQPSGLIPQIATPVAAPDLPLATPPAKPATTRPVQRTAGPAPSIVEAPADIAGLPPISVLRSAPAVQRSPGSGPTGRIEMPAALTMRASPSPVTPGAVTGHHHEDHTHEPEPDAPTVAQRSTDAITVSRHAAEEPADDVAQTSADPVYAQLLSVDAPSALPAADPAVATPSSTADLPVATPSANRPPRRLGLGEPLIGGVPVQRAVTPTPTPAPVAPLPLAATLPAGVTEIRVPPPSSPAPIETPTLGTPTSSPLPAPTGRNTEVVMIGSGPLPLLPPVQRTLDPSSPSTGSLAATIGSTAALESAASGSAAVFDHGHTTAYADRGDTTASPAGPPLTLVGLVGSTPPLLAPPATNTTPDHGGTAGSPAQAVQRLDVGRVPAGAPVARTTAQLISEARNPPALTYAAPGGPAPRASIAQPAGTYLSSLPIATASWVNPSIQRTEAEPSMAPISVSRAVDVPEMTVEPAGGDPAATPGAAPAAGGGAGGDPAAMAEHLFDPLLARLKTELRLDRERRGSLTDLWH